MSETYVNFAGTYDHVLDAKHRLSIPAEIRSDIQAAYGLGSEGTVSFSATLAKNARALSLYTKHDFDQLVGQARTPGRTNGKLVQRLQNLVNNSKQCDVDRQGRILLPESLLTKLARVSTPLKDRVMLVGFIDHLEVWDPAAYERYEAEEANEFVDPLEIMAEFAAVQHPGGAADG